MEKKIDKLTDTFINEIPVINAKILKNYNDSLKPKVCKIINDKLSWFLEVDNKKISFNGSDNADYFANIYTELGYVIEWNKDKWKQD